MALQNPRTDIDDPTYIKCAQYFERGYEILTTEGSTNDKGFLPLQFKQPSAKLFEVDHKDRSVLEFTHSESLKVIDISGESLNEFQVNAKVKAGYSSSSKVMGKTAGTSISARLGFNTEKVNQTIYQLHQEDVKFGFMNFSTTDAQKLLIPSVRKDLIEVKDKLTAKNVMRKYGVGFINQLTLGAQFQSFCEIEKSHFMTTADVQGEVERKMSLSKKNVTEGKASMGITVTSRGRQSRTTLRTMTDGGKPILISDTMAWRESATVHPNVIAYDVEPLYSLVPFNSTAYHILRGVFEEIVETVPLPPSDGNLAEEEYFISVTHNEDWFGFTKSADIKLCYHTKSNVIHQVKKNRDDFLNWRRINRKSTSSSFAEGNEKDVKIKSRRKITSVEYIPKM